MKKLTLLQPPPSSVDRYIGIRDSKHLHVRNVLRTNHQHIAAQYTLFDAAVVARNLESLNASNACSAIGDELRACYGSKTQALGELIKSIKSAQPKPLRKYCPMCGTTRGKTLDHYLPSEEFPEFSVHVANLVPCCALCNSKKDRYWRDANGRRLFIHAYSDDIPEDQFLFVDLHEHNALDGVGATFRLEEPDNVAPATWRLLTTHYSRLGLISRFNEDSGAEIDTILRSCKAFVEAGGLRPRSFLDKMARSTARTQGPNHWLAVLMSAMAAHPRLRGWIDAIDDAG